jgi:hypothetical protein
LCAYVWGVGYYGELVSPSPWRRGSDQTTVHVQVYRLHPGERTHHRPLCVCVCVFCFVVIHDPPLLYMKYMIRQSWVDTLTHGVGGSVGCVMVSLPVLSGLFSNASLGCISPASLSVTPCSGWVVTQLVRFRCGQRERTVDTTLWTWPRHTHPSQSSPCLGVPLACDENAIVLALPCG